MRVVHLLNPVARALTCALTALLGACGGADPAEPATPVLPPGALALANPSFEDDVVADGKYDDKVTPAGWTRYDPAGLVGTDYNSIGVVNPTGTTLYAEPVPHGRNIALIFLWRDDTSGTPVGLEQRTPHLLVAGKTYTLRVGVGNIAHDGAPNYSLVGFPGYRVELLAGDTVIARDDSTLTPDEGKFSVSTSKVEVRDDHPQLGQALSIRVLNLNRPASGIEVNFDDVELVTTAL